jgi:hypothetical protein
MRADSAYHLMAVPVLLGFSNKLRVKNSIEVHVHEGDSCSPSALNQLLTELDSTLSVLIHYGQC